MNLLEGVMRLEYLEQYRPDIRPKILRDGLVRGQAPDG